MILFRAITSEELLNRLKYNDQSVKATIKGENTFKYEDGIEYLHFFKYPEHAFYYKKEKSCVAVLECIIPDEIIEQYGFGFYGGVETYKNNKLFGWYMPLPEYIIRKDKFTSEYIYDIQDRYFSRYIYDKDTVSNETVHKPLDFVDSDHYWHQISQANIYYEIVYKLAKENEHNMYKVARILYNMNLDREVLTFFENNKDIFLKWYEKDSVSITNVEISTFKQKILSLFK